MTTTDRVDLYAFIHKGLRAFMAHALLRAGRLDVHDADEVAEVTTELRQLLDFCEGHVVHENEFVHAAMEARRPGSSQLIADDHVEHLAQIAALRALCDGLGGSPETGRALYRELTAFVAHNYEHMAQEEAVNNAVLWDAYSDDELRAIEQRIHACIPPAEMGLALRWMVPHLNAGERAELMGGMRMGAPAEAFDGALAMLRPLLGGRDWRKLSSALAL